jgi:hypothetical protein
MIQENISREHILLALEEIDQEGIPERRKATRYHLNHEGKQYPPKYVISLANKYANGSELNPDEFSGGKQSNGFLKKRGFSTCKKDQESAVIPTAQLADAERTNHDPHQREEHNERCPQCKATVEAMLKRIYGEVHTAYSFDFGASLGEYASSTLHPVLKEIHSSLQALRGNQEFVRARSLPPVDYYVPTPGFVVEFDERQHFTMCRKLALSQYPDDVPVKFDVGKWMRLCSEINAKDRSPQYRDEQRAWYDTLRDFAPIIHGLRPTVRLYSDDFQWCGLDPNSPDDRAWFEKVLMNGMPQWEIDHLFDPEPWVARVVIDGPWSRKPEDAAKLLNEIYSIWTESEEIRNFKTQFLITCGGFLEFERPSHVDRSLIGDCWNPASGALSALVGAAEQALRQVLTQELLARLAKLTKYVTVGVDSSKKLVSTTKNYISTPHVELVSLVDTQTGHSIWTGKSYPTNAQQNGLVRIENLETHFVTLPDIGTTMILGCHDLNAFNNRNFERTGLSRKNIKNDLRQLARKRGPVAILHHPHTTPSTHTWASAWGWVRAELPSVKWYASAGRYDSDKELPELHDTTVLVHTRQGASIDFVVRTPLC